MRPLKEVERSEYSQNGEDGIIEHLVERLHTCSKNFVEIGCGSGKENNTTNLVHKGWSGAVFEIKKSRVQEYEARGFMRVQAYCTEASTKTAPKILDNIPDPEKVDLFSIDIDSYDIHVAARLLELGLKPQIVVAEYNASFGDEPVSIPNGTPVHKDIYCGAGVTAWVNMMLRHAYEFVTVESSGTNAFFIKKGCGTWEFEGIAWADSTYQRGRFGTLRERAAYLTRLPLERWF